LDEYSNPLLNEYKELAISNLVVESNENVTESVSFFIFFVDLYSLFIRKIHRSILKLTIIVLLLPSIVIYFGVIKSAPLNAIKGKSLTDILNIQNSFLSKVNNNQNFIFTLSKKTLNRAILLNNTNSFRLGFSGWRSALLNLFKK
jgi:hypothetical protein